MDKSTFDKLWVSIWNKSDPPPPEGEYQGGGFVQQDKEELWQLTQRVGRLSPKNILEIGCAGGGTLLLWQALASGVVSVDIQGLNGGRGFLPLDQFPSVTFILGDCHHYETFEEVKLLGPYDFLFIDGDHTREGVSSDYTMYAPLVKKGGIVAFHDWNYQAGPVSHYPIRECVSKTGIIPEVIEHSHFGIAVLYV